jgi:transglutaminase/protease-like cytokinesis protein 3
LILLLICAAIVLAITLPIVLTNKNKNQTDENSSNKNEAPIIIEIDTTKQFDFNTINIDDKYNGIGEKSNDLTTCCNYLSEISSGINDKEKVYLIYKWVANNIQYDSGDYIEPVAVLTNKKGKYSGYANLFTKLLTCLNFPAENIKNIKGHSKGIGFNYEDAISDDNTNHEWNAVKIDNKWCLIDTTWGANTIKDGAYEPKYNE